MGVLKFSTVSLAVSFILGCSSGPGAAPGAAAAPAPGAAAAPAPGKTVFDPLTRDLQKARDVQNAADGNADATRKAVDSQERGDSPP
jgi:hypothetical protein